VRGRAGERAGDELTGRSRAIARVREQIRHLAATHSNVLIEGAAGTGKRLVARAIHRGSPRRHAPFVELDLGGSPAEAIERDLFGVEMAGASPHPGRLEAAEGGTLYLADADTIPAAIQVRLLRLLQHREFERVGGGETLKADVRILASSRAPIEREVREGRLREDLAVRLGVGRIALPTLREREEDIPPLVERFVLEANREHRRKVTVVTRGALERLVRHDWPGNVRELERTIDTMVMAAAGRRPLGLSDLPAAMREEGRDAGALGLEVGMTVEEVEETLVRATLAHTGGDKRRAAALLGIGLRTLYRKLSRYGLDASGRPGRRRPGR
jgi:DNA-binding NtrC family response regulator